ncbi:MAG: glycine zipper 2TM domain-containing protein [Gammaproteobacteria bacterium]|nr:MAG: glycine zipper 2TM domain-containing protein [Gammaproteobacteria bacterium]
MKSPLFVRSILAISMSMFAGYAFADHGHRHHHHRHHNDTYVYAVYGSDYGSRSYEDYGRVVDARPIYRQVAVDVPRERCGVRTVATEERRRGGDSFAGTVVGGLVGAAIGHEIGNGRGSATAVGGLIGASIGNDASKGGRTVRYRDEEVCRTEYRTEYEQRIIGYDVSYSYQGRIYQTQTDRHPGDRIAIDLAVR